MFDQFLAALQAEEATLTQEIEDLTREHARVQALLEEKQLQRKGIQSLLTRRYGVGSLIAVLPPAEEPEKVEDNRRAPLTQVILRLMEEVADVSANELLSLLAREDYRPTRSVLNTTLHDLRRAGKLDKALRGRWSLPKPPPAEEPQAATIAEESESIVPKF